MQKVTQVIAMALMAGLATASFAGDFTEQVTHEFADSDGVKIHYAKAGEGPLVVFIHGFPDYWYTWRYQMAGLMGDYTVAAMDTRGYNKSDKPEGVENYDMKFLVADVAAVIENEGRDSAVIVGHDWGGAIAWSFAALMPEMTDKLIIMNLPHPAGLTRELRENPQQRANSQYARNFQRPDSHESINAAALASMLSRGDADLKAKYLTAFENSSMDAMMNYYRANFPREPYEDGIGDIPKVKAPVLQFHGLNDSALLPGGLNDTWEHLEKDWTLITLPGVGHWSQGEAAERITSTMKWWLASQE